MLSAMFAFMLYFMYTELIAIFSVKAKYSVQYIMPVFAFIFLLFLKLFPQNWPIPKYDILPLIIRLHVVNILSSTQCNNSSLLWPEAFHGNTQPTNFIPPVVLATSYSTVSASYIYHNY